MKEGEIMKKIDNLYIDSFKGIENLELNKCGDINIIVGDNNTCKTTVLEAIRLFQYPNDFSEIIQISRKRIIDAGPVSRISRFESFLNMFNAKQMDNIRELSLRYSSESSINKLKITGDLKEVYFNEDDIDEMSNVRQITKERYMEDMTEDKLMKEFSGCVEYNNEMNSFVITELTDSFRDVLGRKFHMDEAIKVNYLSSVDHMRENFSTKLISQAIENNEKSGLLDLLKLFDENIEGLEIVAAEAYNRPVLKIKYKNYNYMPISSFGDGLKKVLALASIMLSIENGVLLIDEIETAIHTSALSDVFSWLLKSAKRQNVQIFTTTHSEEALSNFLTNNENYGLNISVFRLESDQGQIIARRFSEEKARRIIIENGGDLR